MEHANLRASSYARGDVLSSAGRHGLVWSMSETGAVLLPIIRHNVPRHRADVTLDDLSDMIALGCGGTDMLIRCGSPAHANPRTMIRTGKAPIALLRRVETAMARNAAAAATEASTTLRHTERCVRL